MKVGIVEDRLEVISKYAYGKRILDLGCVGEGPSPSWLHFSLVQWGKEVLGVDIDKTKINRLRKLGYNVICGNAERIKINKKFDVVIAGELIEHLSNPGLFLENIKKNLKEDGILIVTTPNAHQSSYFFSGIKKKISESWRKRAFQKRHVVLFTFDTMKTLIERHGFSIIEFYYWTGKLGGLRGSLAKLFYSIFPHFSPNLLFVLKPSR